VLCQLQHQQHVVLDLLNALLPHLALPLPLLLLLIQGTGCTITSLAAACSACFWLQMVPGLRQQLHAVAVKRPE
jgi:hypothetical protein